MPCLPCFFFHAKTAARDNLRLPNQRRRQRGRCFRNESTPRAHRIPISRDLISYAGVSDEEEERNMTMAPAQVRRIRARRRVYKYITGSSLTQFQSGPQRRCSEYANVQMRVCMCGREEAHSGIDVNECRRLAQKAGSVHCTFKRSIPIPACNNKPRESLRRETELPSHRRGGRSC